MIESLSLFSRFKTLIHITISPFPLLLFKPLRRHILSYGLGAGTVAGATLPKGYVHFIHDVILFTHCITYFSQRVILEQNFMSPTHVKNKVQNEI